MAKVLIVDDASFMRMTIKQMLEKNGHEAVGEAADGIEAVKKFIASGNIFCIITGRTYMEIKPDLLKLDLPYTYLVCADGALIFDSTDYCLKTVKLDKEVVKRAVEILKENGGLAIVEEEAEMVRKIFDMYANADMGIRGIAKILTEMGYRNTSGNGLSYSTVKGILINPKYKGFYCGNKTHKVHFLSNEIVYLPKDEWVVYENNEKVT